MSKNNFQVAIMHGHNTDYLEIKEYVKTCQFSPRILIEEYSADTIFENLRNLIWDEVHCVIVMMTQDDDMLKGSKRARQNVIFELGYCFGAFDSLPDWSPYGPEDAIIVIAEKEVELFADIHGLTRIEYESGKLADKREFIIKCIERSYEKAKKYYLFDSL